MKHVFEAILNLDMDLEHTLLLFDENGDGTVELKELRQVLRRILMGILFGIAYCISEPINVDERRIYIHTLYYR